MRANFIPAIIVGILIFVLFRRSYLRCSSIISRITLVLVGLILAFPAILFASNYLLLIPSANWYYALHAQPWAEVSSGLVGGILGIMFASARLRRGILNGFVLVVCSFFAISLIITPFAKQLFYAADNSSLKDTWKDGVCLQSSGHTCVPACVATLVRLQGGNLTEPNLAKAAGTSRRGTEFWYMDRVLRKKGYVAKIHHVRSVHDAPVPSILGVKPGSGGHVVVLLEKDDEGITIAEPLHGRCTYTWSVFTRNYHPTNSCITISESK